MKLSSDMEAEKLKMMYEQLEQLLSDVFKVAERIKQMYEKFNKNMKKLGYDESSLEEFLNWLEDQVELG